MTGLDTAMIALCCAMPTLVLATDLTVNIENVKDDHGSLIVSLFSVERSESFPAHDDQAFRKTAVRALEGRTVLVFQNLNDGEYAISVVHDENDNGRMDHNALKMPKEGFGFSNQPSLIFGLPSFKRAAFTVSPSARDIKIPLTYW